MEACRVSGVGLEFGTEGGEACADDTLHVYQLLPVVVGARLISTRDSLVFSWFSESRWLP